MHHRKSLSPFSEKVRVIQFTCLRLEFLYPIVNEPLKLNLKIKDMQQLIKYKITNYKTQAIEVFNHKIKIEIQNLGMSQLDLNTYQAFSLEKVPIYDKKNQKQLIGFLCFKIDETSKKSTPNASIQNSREQSLNFGSNLFTIAFSDQTQYQNPKPQNQVQKCSHEDIKKNIDQIAQIYEEMSREQNQLLQQDLKLKKLDNEIKDLNQQLKSLHDQEHHLDIQFKKLQTQSPQLQMLINQKIQQQYSILTFKRKQENPIQKQSPQQIIRTEQNSQRQKKTNVLPQQVTISLIEQDKFIKKQNKEPEIPVNMSIPFSFNEYFSLFKN
ncbi:unnamed protein product [Paramecium sonneborni]|uniref:C2 NT-type domain-containing protein n=1 Tax=Paramecium sonneborni TaxID=65129 RepID=A0A8S1LDH0_9CILI|nr:unnamed protein product [Paramecium sonneborni]